MTIASTDPTAKKKRPKSELSPGTTFKCGRCNLARSPAEGHPCPKCGCPEYEIIEPKNAPSASPDAPQAENLTVSMEAIANATTGTTVALVEVASEPMPEPDEANLILSHLTEINRRNGEITILHNDYLAVAEEAKSAKRQWEAAQVDLSTYISKGWKPEPMPLFDKPKPAKPAKPTEDETWRIVPIEMLELPPGIVAKLTEAGITTIGGIAYWSKTGKPLTDIPGIGHAAGDKIDEAMTAFWKAEMAK